MRWGYYVAASTSVRVMGGTITDALKETTPTHILRISCLVLSMYACWYQDVIHDDAEKEDEVEYPARAVEL